MGPQQRTKLGRVFVVSGLVTIFVSVIFVLEAANGPGTGPKTFSQRRSYNQVKESLHSTFPIAFLVSMGGLGLIMAGVRMTRAEDSTP
jgi:hypothetical protein